ncbi:hypothetical protein DM01DRAFT_1166039 [Hesseltinella vesiculosa]|uniref:Cyclic nucleotide-binding domain-containing protein n=1 Tax=Hesseltinella vesiculosa TaxID=101127 RepID=A0A1X2GTF9_9FUNG|nr:hypothetical protein DM01DRAFT_1166039 [Hesseltinella vesiculosa]
MQMPDHQLWLLQQDIYMMMLTRPTRLCYRCVYKPSIHRYLKKTQLGRTSGAGDLFGEATLLHLGSSWPRVCTLVYNAISWCSPIKPSSGLILVVSSVLLVFFFFQVGDQDPIEVLAALQSSNAYPDIFSP